MAYASLRYSATACADFTGSNRSSTKESILRPYSFAVEYMNCHIPLAPALDTAVGLRADSIMARAFSSSGMSCSLNISSNIGM